MALVRFLVPALVGSLLGAVQLAAQEGTGTITGRVVDSTSQQPLAGASIRIDGTMRGALTRDDGSFLLSAVPAGTHSLRAARIGYAPRQQQVTVTGGATVTVEFVLHRQAAALTEVVVTGYGTQRREAITGSVATVDADAANVGVVSNANQMIQGRVAGVNIVANNGEPGAGMQIRIRGGTSISASNEPLYVIDGVPVNNTQTEATGIANGGEPPLARSPLNLLNPADIASITILKDAAAAIYGTSAANGVILIETKKGGAGTTGLVYDGYVATAFPSRHLDVLNGAEYRAFVEREVAAGNLPADRLDGLGPANTDWEREVTRTAMTQNHNLSFSGGAANTQFRASLNYMDQKGVVLSSGFERLQGRLNASHQALESRLRLQLNLTASQVKNDYIPFETTGGFEGGVFQNVAIYNPTRPVRRIDPVSGQEVFFETGPGRQEARNPVALTQQIQDFATTNRTLGNISGEVDILPSLTAKVNVGADRSEGVRRTYFPRLSPFGAEWNGRARQVQRDNTSVTLQTLLNFRQQVAAVHDIDVVGGYEYSDYSTGEFGAEGRGFVTDALSFNNLGGSSTIGFVLPFSWREESRQVSFFSRANYGFQDRYFVTAILRRDGSSRFGAGHKWANFPAISASWRISEEDFMRYGWISDLRLRGGWGRLGNPAVPPYASLTRLEASSSSQYVFGNLPVTGVAPVQLANPNLKWEQTTQTNVALDYGFLSNRFTGSVEYYVKKTEDLLLTVPVPQPALVSERLENIGSIRNKGLEMSLDAQVVSRPTLNWTAGLVFAAERNTVVDLGGRSFINTGIVSGQGQSGVRAQRIMPGRPIGTFYGARFVGLSPDGKQLFSCRTASATCVNGQTTEPSADDYDVIGNANPDFTLGLRSQADWGRFDFSFLVRSAVGQDVFNNTALVYGTKTNVITDKNFLRSALDDRDDITEPAKFSSRWIEDGSFVRLQNVTVGYTFGLPTLMGRGQALNTRVYLSGDNLLLLTGYDGLDPEVHADAGLASRSIDYLSYPRPRTITGGVRVTF